MTMIHSDCTSARRAAPRTVPSPRFSIVASLMQAHAVWRQRRQLKSLDAAALSDIGVTHAQAQAEAKRSVWDAPHQWTR